MKKKFEFAEFCKGVEGVLDIKEKVLNDPACTRDWRNRLQALKDNPLRIVVMGECKRGKSSFVNALLGIKDLVPVATDVATSTVFRIHYGEKVSYKVWFGEDAQRDPLVVPFEELSQYGTEDGNPNNEKGVASIEVTCPSPLLENQVEIVDTPGLGGLFKNHKAITYQYVPFADAVFVVTDSDGSPIGQPELDLLKDLKEVTQNIYFVQTKSRLVDEDVREARRRNNVEILVGQASFEEENLKYFVVDSNRKFDADKSGDAKILKRSGFDAVISFMDTVICPNARMLSAKRFSDAFTYEHLNIRGLLDEKKNYVCVATPKELAQLESDVKKVLDELSTWQSKTLPVRRHAFELEIMDAESEISSKIAAYGADGEYGQDLRSRIYSAQSLKSLRKAAEGIQSEIGGIFAELNENVRIEMIEKFNESLRMFIGECGSGMYALNRDKIKTRDVNQVHEKKYKDYKGDDRVNRAVSSFFAGFYRGALVYGAVGSMFGGPTGAAIGATIGLFDFSRRTWKAASTKDLSSGQAYYWQQIMIDLSQNSKRITSSYSDFLRKARNELFFAIEQSIKDCKCRMDQNILNLKRKFARKTQENALEKATLAKLEQSFEANSALLKIG